MQPTNISAGVITQNRLASRRESTEKKFAPDPIAIVSILTAWYLNALLMANYETFDLNFYAPLIREFQFPGLYASTDILITAGRQGVFHFYRFLSLFLPTSGPIDSAIFGIYLACLLFCYTAMWYLVRFVTQNRIASAITILALGVMPVWRGGLNYAPIPVNAMVSRSIAQPFMILSAVLFLKRKYVPGLFCLMIVFTLHPGLGLIVLSGFLGLLFFDEGSYRKKFAYASGGVVALLPNLVFLVTSLRENWFPASGQSIPSADFSRIFQSKYGAMAYPEWHWVQDYGWFFLFLPIVARATAVLTTDVKKRIYPFSLGLLALLVAFVANLYLIRYHGGILFFSFRVTELLKIFFLSTVALWVLTHWKTFSKRSWYQHALIILIVTVAFLDPIMAFVAEGALCLCLAMLLLRDGNKTIAALVALWGISQIGLRVSTLLPAVAPHAYTIQWYTTTFNVVIGVAMVCWWAMRPRPVFTEPDLALSPWKTTLALCAVCYVVAVGLSFRRYKKLILVPNPTILVKNLTISAPHEGLQGLYEWFRVKAGRGSLIVLPPYDRKFMNFRISTERGVYIHHMDMYQLAYDLRFFFEGERRLNLVGPTSEAYNKLSISTLRHVARDGATHAVFEASKLQSDIRSLEPDAERDGYLVLDLRKLPPSSK